MPYIASTLATAVTYVDYSATHENGLPHAKASVTIEGGFGVANKNLITPQGVVTPVTDEQLAVLCKVELFRTHEANGFVQVLDKNPGDPERASADMNRNDPSAPLTDASYEGAAESGGAAPAAPALPKRGR